MKCNVGSIERILRVIVGVVLITLTSLGQIGVWGYIGVLLLVTGLFRYCPMYSLIGKSPCGSVDRGCCRK
jgi:hypothetical protein